MKNKKIWETPVINVLSVKSGTTKDQSSGAIEYFSNKNNPGPIPGPGIS
jgi:hypothetical protein